MRVQITNSADIPKPQFTLKNSFNKDQVPPVLIGVVIVSAILAISIVSVYIYATCACRKPIPQVFNTIILFINYFVFLN